MRAAPDRPFARNQRGLTFGTSELGAKPPRQAQAELCEAQDLCTEKLTNRNKALGCAKDMSKSHAPVRRLGCARVSTYGQTLYAQREQSATDVCTEIF
jgi:hypothetical protein